MRVLLSILLLGVIVLTCIINEIGLTVEHNSLCHVMESNRNDEFHHRVESCSGAPDMHECLEEALRADFEQAVKDDHEVWRIRSCRHFYGFPGNCK